jgi:hypothetical protein
MLIRRPCRVVRGITISRVVAMAELGMNGVEYLLRCRRLEGDCESRAVVDIFPVLDDRSVRGRLVTRMAVVHTVI